jgi:transcriptional regulator GlxA family with amidase domain
MRRNVAILIFDDVEVLDFAGPFEVFAVTDELRAGSAYRVFTVAGSVSPVRARNGLTVVPDFSCASNPAPDLLVVPGGFGTRALLRSSELIQWIREQAAAAELTMSVCTGSLLLAKAGLLDGLRATTHHEVLDLLRELAPASTVLSDERFVDNGRILTAAGVSAGIDCALHVVERQLGIAAADATVRYMEYRRP